jgi:excisionase family DNA binding protein
MRSDMTTVTDSPERLTYRPREIAELTGLSLQSVYDAIKRGELKAVRVGQRSLVIPRAALAEFVSEDARPIKAR